MRHRHILVANVFFAPYSYGGATVVAEQVARALMRIGPYRVTAVSLFCRDDLAPYVVVKSQKDGIENYLINVPRHRKYAEMYDNPEVTARLAELVAALEPDLIHAHCLQEIGTGLMSVAEAAEVPVILSVHDFWWLCERQFMIRVDGRYCNQSPVQIDQCKGCVDNFWAAKTRAQHLKHMGAKAAFVTYPSQFAKELSEASGFAPGRGVVWQNGVQQPGPDFFARQARRRADDPRVSFGYLGGPSDIKGWPLIAAACTNTDRQDLRGIVVDGSLDQGWWKEGDLKGLRGDWSIHPRFAQDDIDTFYSQIDVLLFMSQWKETFGLAIREALVRGIEVIQTDSGGTVEHDAVSRQRLIPIGAPPGELQSQIEAVLDRGAAQHTPVPVPSFEDQARALVKLIEGSVFGLTRVA